MMTNRFRASIAVLVLVTSSCVRVNHPALQPSPSVPGATLWRDPGNIARQDLYLGPWGAAYAPDPDAVYRFVEAKHNGVNPGMTVVDPGGREWSVKQLPPGGLDREAQVEVTISRLLSALGYHQPPVFFLPSFKLHDAWGVHATLGGRFRPKLEALAERTSWSWQENPFIGTRPYQGLLVLMMMFNSTDLKNSNNSICEYRQGNRREFWYVARDIGSALGDTARLGPFKSDPDAFERQPYIVGVNGKHVKFGYTGYYERLVRERITPEDVVWISNRLARLSEAQWRDAFRAGGYSPDIAQRFIRKLREKVRAAAVFS